MRPRFTVSTRSDSLASVADNANLVVFHPHVLVLFVFRLVTATFFATAAMATMRPTAMALPEVPTAGVLRSAASPAPVLVPVRPMAITGARRLRALALPMVTVLCATVTVSSLDLDKTPLITQVISV